MEQFKLVGQIQQNNNEQESQSSPAINCPFCPYSNTLELHVQMHILTAHHQQQPLNDQQQQQQQSKSNSTIPTILCPLCQEPFNEKNHLECHLVEIHNVNKEGVQRLMLLVDTTDSHMKQSGGGGGGSQYQCWRNGCGQTFKTVMATQQHFKEQHFAKCIKLTNNSASNLPSNASVSDRHVYKYRCTQCSLAFKTFEKLQLHSQYHLIRAATQCVICGRSFRSVESLQKHVESSHSNLNDDELEQYKANLINNQLLFALGRNGGILDPSTTELLKKESFRNENDNDDESMDMENGAIDLANNNNNKDHDSLLDNNMEQTSGQSSNLDNVSSAVNIFNGNVDNATLEDYLNSQHLAEDNYNDPNRRFKCHRCKVAFTRQSYLTSHNKTLLHRKGEKMSYPMEKYLDPNRPFKCEICKESFTQKNILLVHYNSVSHLHKLKQSMKESSAAVAASVLASATNNSNHSSTTSTVNESMMNEDDNNENKLYKCNLCKVNYSMASSLHQHLRSSLHQQRTSKLHELAQSGQLDLSLPLIEPINQNDMNINNNNSPSSSMTKINSTSVETSAKTNSTSPNLNKFPEMLMANLNEQQQQALAFQQAALNLALATRTNPNQTGSFDNNQTSSMMNQMNGGGAGNSQSPFTCVKCGASFISQEAQIQHQQLCGLFGNITNVTNMQLVAAQQAKQQALSKLSNLHGPLYRNKPQLYKHLLETWGFEIVMQFNESNQKNKNPDDCNKNIDDVDEENIVNNVDDDNDDDEQQSKNDKIDEIVTTAANNVDTSEPIEQTDDSKTMNNKQENIDDTAAMTETTNGNDDDDNDENATPEINKCQC
ncbi:zinc finger homeobox protein 4-like protein, partial [Euroglyphus maynei]